MDGRRRRKGLLLPSFTGQTYGRGRKEEEKSPFCKTSAEKKRNSNKKDLKMNSGIFVKVLVSNQQNKKICVFTCSIEYLKGVCAAVLPGDFLAAIWSGNCPFLSLSLPSFAAHLNRSKRKELKGEGK